MVKTTGFRWSVWVDKKCIHNSFYSTDALSFARLFENARVVDNTNNEVINTWLGTRWER